MIDYQDGMQLELWVRDTGLFDGFAVFVNGSIVTTVGDQKTHKFPIPKPTNSEAIAVNFGGQDGGTSAIIDVADPSQLATLETQTGVNHGYIVKPG
jgi:hypothetical protein